jgi:hypothetical protein
MSDATARATGRLDMLPLALFLALALAGGCATEWDADVVFPANYTSTYTKVVSCEASQHPAAKYVEVWLDPTAKAAWDEYAALPKDTTATIAYPEGAVMVKTQFDDASCKDLKNFTAMKKLAKGAAPSYGDYRWQHVDVDGACLNCDNGKACSGCHTQAACKDFACSFPE